MDDWAQDQNEEKSPSRRTTGLAWAIVVLIFLMVVVDLIATTSLGVNSNETFQTGSAKKQ